MYANPVAYVFSCIFVLIAHIAMLLNVYFNGNYTEVRDVAVLGAAVLILDISYFIVILLFKQTSYVLDFLLILVLNMSFIFQSCFGKVGFDVKHLITCIVCLASCKAGYIICRNHKLLQDKKPYIYGGVIFVMLIVLVFTSPEDMWIRIGSFAMQPSEFAKPLLMLLIVSRIAMLLILRSPYRPRAIIMSRLDKPKNSGVSVAFEVNMPVSDRVLIPSGIAAESISSMDCLVI